MMISVVARGLMALDVTKGQTIAHTRTIATTADKGKCGLSVSWSNSVLHVGCYQGWFPFWFWIQL